MVIMYHVGAIILCKESYQREQEPLVELERGGEDVHHLVDAVEELEQDRRALVLLVAPDPLAALVAEAVPLLLEQHLGLRKARPVAQNSQW